METVRVEAVMGTIASLRVVNGDMSPALAADALDDACKRLHAVDQMFSTWNPESPVSRLRSGRLSPGEVPAEVRLVEALCRQAREMSGGYFDPWALPGGFDPTGLVKGWAGDEALAVLRRAGAAAAMVNIGGDICVYGHPQDLPRWRVGIRHPWRESALATVLELGVEAAVATSGPYERGGDDLFDPHASGITPAASATVLGTRLDFTDGLATALAVGGDEVIELLCDLEGYEGYLIRADGSERFTPGFAAEPPTRDPWAASLLSEPTW